MKSLAEVQQTYLTEAYRFILPEMVLLGTACLLFVLAVVAPRRSLAFALAFAGLVGAAVLAACLTVPSLGAPLGFSELGFFWDAVEGSPHHPRAITPFDPTGPAAFVRFVALGFGAVLLLLAWNETRTGYACEYLACQLVAIAGVSLTTRANDIVSLFLSLEMLSIPTYVLLYLPVRNKAGQEAAVKYFLLSILSSAVMLFGFSYLYGQTGTTNLGAIVDTLNDAHKTEVGVQALLAIVMVVAGLCFRVTAFPFHFYAPDVYQGGPTGVIAQLAFMPKVAGFLALARVLGMLYPPLDRLPFDGNATTIPMFLWILSVASMTIGNVFALLQTNVRRMFAFSGVANAGYMLIGFVTASCLPDQASNAQLNQFGLDSMLFYLVAYGLMTVGSFAVLAYLAVGDQPTETLDDLAGLSRTHPAAAGLMALFLFSMIGLPLTAGFAGKMLLFIGAFNVPTTGSLTEWPQILAAFAALNAAVAAIYYLRLIGVMYLRSPLQPTVIRSGRAALLAALICGVGTVALGVYPKPLVDAAKRAVPYRDDRPKPAVALLP